MDNATIIEFFNRIKQQHINNIKKWGHQGKYIVLAACMEELGELARAILGNAGENHDICNEAGDLAALLIEMYILGKEGRC
jgi:NTP pyrophosphatase (non-canonical NTP hydrolase)